MRYLSVCSGIEAASAAWHPLGWTPVAFSEIEPFPCAVLAHHYPEVPNLGDMTKFKEWPDYDIDVLVGGTPCQSFSVAGLRKGLADPRGNLMLTYLAIADKYRPKWLVWENVPGVLSSNGGQDFGTFLGGLGELGYGFAYRVLDAQYFGVPQRRRRVFVVGCLGDWRGAAAVLFERHSLQGNPPPSRKARQDVAGTISSRTTGGGGLGTDFELGGGFSQLADELNEPARSLRAQAQASHRADSETYVPVMHAEISPALKARDSKGPSSDGDGDGAILVPMVAPTLLAQGNKTGGDRPPGTTVDTADSLIVTHSLRGEGFDASEDGTGRGTPLVPVCVHADAVSRTGEATTPSPDANGSIRLRNPGLGILHDGTSYNLMASGVPHAVAFSCKDHGADAGEVSPTLRSMGHDGSHANAGGQVAVAFAQNQRDEVRLMDVAGALAAEPGAKQQTYAHVGMQVRRLTPMECERLQGFKDGYTLIPVRGKPSADGPRYKALGNSMAEPCMRWLGERIDQVRAVQDEKAAA